MCSCGSNIAVFDGSATWTVLGEAISIQVGPGDLEPSFSTLEFLWLCLLNGFLEIAVPAGMGAECAPNVVVIVIHGVGVHGSACDLLDCLPIPSAVFAHPAYGSCSGNIAVWKPKPNLI